MSSYRRRHMTQSQVESIERLERAVTRWANRDSDANMAHALLNKIMLLLEALHSCGHTLDGESEISAELDYLEESLK